MNHFLRSLLQETNMGRSLGLMAGLLGLAQIFELWALTLMVHLTASGLTIQQMFLVMGLFSLKAVLNVASSLLSSSTFLRLNYTTRTKLFHHLAGADFLLARGFVQGRMGYVGRGLAESLMHVVQGGLQLVFGVIFLLAMFFIGMSVGPTIALTGAGLAAGLVVLSYLMNSHLKTTAQAVIECEAGFEREWAEQLQLWSEKVQLGIRTGPGTDPKLYHRHWKQTLRRDFWRVVQGPTFEVVFLLGLFGVLLYLQKNQSHSSAALVTGILFLQRLQARIQSCLVGWQQIRDEWPILSEILKLPPVACTDTPTSGTKGLQLESLNFRYNDQSIFEQVSMQVKPGDWVGVSGRNGSGKTTLGQMLMGLLPPSSGTIHWGDNKKIPRTALVTSHVTLINDDLMANLDLGRGLDRSTIELRLKELGLWTWFKPWHHSEALADLGLSTGERQLIGLARALLEELDLIFLDEATSHLSEKLEQEFFINLKARFPELMVFVVSHRRSVDRIFTQTFNLDQHRPTSTIHLPREKSPA